MTVVHIQPIFTRWRRAVLNWSLPLPRFYHLRKQEIKMTERNMLSTTWKSSTFFWSIWKFNTGLSTEVTKDLSPPVQKAASHASFMLESPVESSAAVSIHHCRCRVFARCCSLYLFLSLTPTCTREKSPSNAIQECLAHSHHALALWVERDKDCLGGAEWALMQLSETAAEKAQLSHGRKVPPKLPLSLAKLLHRRVRNCSCTACFWPSRCWLNSTCNKGQEQACRLFIKFLIAFGESASFVVLVQWYTM